MHTSHLHGYDARGGTSTVPGSHKQHTGVVVPLAQYTRGSAAAIVTCRERRENLDGREAWQEIEQMYAGLAQDQGPMQLLNF